MQTIFGTDGIRGKYNKEITYLLACKIGFAFGKNLKSQGPILIGRDTRVSGKSLMGGLIKGINAANQEAIDIGICPTPAIPCLVKELCLSGGIMISASHNPPEYNGIKLFDMDGRKIQRQQENIIEKDIKQINDDYFLGNISIKFDQRLELLEIYEQTLLNSIGANDLNGLKIVLDTCHGSATSCAEKIFKRLGAKTFVINDIPDGSKINVNCGSTFLEPLKKAIYEHQADMGFSFDGDADRVIGVDSFGNVMDGDHILFLWGRELLAEHKLSNKLLISTDMANLGFEKAWNNLGGILFRTEVGDKFIYQEISRQKAQLGGEQSGHILSNINNYSGDGILTALQISNYCKMKQINLNQWLNTSFSPYPQRLTNLPLPFKIKTLNSSLKRSIDLIINQTLDKTLDHCRIFVRPSGTEPLLRILVEATHEDLVKDCSNIMKDELEEFIRNRFNY